MGLSVGSRGPLFDYKLDHISFQTLFWSMDHLVKISHKNWSTFLLQKTIEAADRFHLVKNLAEAVEKALTQCRTELQKGLKAKEAAKSDTLELPLLSRVTVDGTPSRFVCKEGQSRNKQGEKREHLLIEKRTEQKEAAEVCKSHQGKSPLRGFCYTGTATKRISL
jgi:hypothetical protein